MTKPPFSAILSLALFETSRHGGIAQLARACGSYPQCPRFKSRCRYQNNNGHSSDSIWRNGPVVKRLRLRPFTAATRVRVPSGSPPIFSRSIWRHSSAGRASASHAEGHRFEFCCLHHAKNHTKRCGSFAILDRSAGDLLQSLFLRRRKMRCSRIFLFSVLAKRKEEIVVRHF